MKIAVGSDHAGYEDPPPYYKPAIEEHLRSLGHEVIDCGTGGPEAVDYPDVAKAVAKSIQSGEAEAGVLLCGAGIGMSIAANRHKGIRAASVDSDEMARLSRSHNNANVLCLGRRIHSLEEVTRYIDIWLNTPYHGEERHNRRIGKIDE